MEDYVNLNLSLDKIFAILDEDDPVKHAGGLRSILKAIKKGVRRSGLDDEVLDMLNEYLDSWLADGALEEDIDSFIEETNDIYEKVVDEDSDDDEEADDEEY